MGRQYPIYRYLGLILIMLTVSLSGASAQTHPLNSVIQGGLSSQTNNSEQELPDPVRLTAAWWQYFELAEGEELQKRIDAFLERIDNQVALVGEAEQQKYTSQISHLKANFAAYVTLKTRDNPIAPPKEMIKDHYNLSDLMAVIHHEREVQTQVNRTKQDIGDQEKQYRELSRQLNSLMVSFIELPSNAAGRFDKVLAIILQQTEVALIDERLRIQRKNLLIEENRLLEASKLRDGAVERLVFTEDERTALKQEATRLERELKEANTRLLRAQSQVLLTPEETAEDRAVMRLRNQQALKEKINLAVLETRLYIYLNELDSLSLLAKDEMLDVERIQKRLSDRQRKLQEITVVGRDWFNQNELERANSNTFLADVESKGSTDHNTFLASIAKDRLVLVQETSVLLQKLQTEMADVHFLSSIIEKQLLSYQGPFFNWINRTKSTLSYGWRNTKQLLRTALFKVGDTPITPLSFAQFLLIVFVCWWVAFWLNKILFRIGNKRGDEKLPAYYIVGRLLYYSVILFGFLYALTAIGIDFTNFALVAGALAIGLGFGLQSIVNNFVSGLILLFERSIKVGDFIELQDRGLWGEVKEINVRATIISDNDNVDIVIPNSELINTKMMNWTLKEPHRRMRYPFKVAYGTDKELVREAVLAAAEALPHTLKGIPGRNPAVWLTNFAEFYYEFELVVWLTARAVKRPNGVRAAYMWAIDNALREFDIEIPVPQRELRFREGSALPVTRYKQQENMIFEEDDLPEDDPFLETEEIEKQDEK